MSIKMALFTTELESGLTKDDYTLLLSILDPDDNGYIPIEFSANNTSAYGFVGANTYEELDYNCDRFNAIILDMLEDWNKIPKSNILSFEDKFMIYIK